MQTVCRRVPGVYPPPGPCYDLPCQSDPLSRAPWGGPPGTPTPARSFTAGSCASSPGLLCTRSLRLREVLPLSPGVEGVGQTGLIGDSGSSEPSAGLALVTALLQFRSWSHRQGPVCGLSSTDPCCCHRPPALTTLGVALTLTRPLGASVHKSSEPVIRLASRPTRSIPPAREDLGWGPTCPSRSPPVRCPGSAEPSTLVIS